MSDPAHPQRPDDRYLRALNEATARAGTGRRAARLCASGAPDALRTHVTEAVRIHAAALVALSHDLHAHPEVGFAEHRSVRAVPDLLRGHGHHARIGVGGVDTALLATRGEGGPHVAVLAEYDALPGVGHACGHNIICATGVGGFLAAAGAVDETGGRLSLIGTPAEEGGGGGKETLARAGVFDDVDAVVMLHPFSHDVAMRPFLGHRQVEMVFHGVAAHAAAQPFMGRDALDAAVAAYQGVAVPAPAVDRPAARGVQRRRWAVNQEPAGRTALPPGVVPEFLTGSTDLGNLSYRMPAIHPMIAVADEALHTAGFATASGGGDGDRAVRDGALGLALTAVDHLADAGLRDAVHAAFAAAGGALDVPRYFD